MNASRSNKCNKAQKQHTENRAMLMCCTALGATKHPAWPKPWLQLDLAALATSPAWLSPWSPLHDADPATSSWDMVSLCPCISVSFLNPDKFSELSVQARLPLCQFHRYPFQGTSQHNSPVHFLALYITKCRKHTAFVCLSFIAQSAHSCCHCRIGF